MWKPHPGEVNLVLMWRVSGTCSFRLGVGDAYEQVYHRDQKYSLQKKEKRRHVRPEAGSLGWQKEWARLSQLASSCRIHMVSVACSPANQNSEICFFVFFLPLSHNAKFLAVLSVGEKVTGAKAVAGRTSHVSKTHSQWLFRVPVSSWMKSNSGRLLFRLPSTQALQQGRDIKVGVI